MATPIYPSSTGGFIPQATGQVISLTRDPKKFPVNKYVQHIDAKKPVGIYYVLDRDAPARVVTDEESAWEDGDPAPKGHHELGGFRGEMFRCKRRAFNYSLGEEAVENADWEVHAFQAAIAAQRAMTARTFRIITMLELASNWGTHTATASSLGGGYWDTSSNDEASGEYLTIKNTLMAVAIQINLATNATVQMSDLRLIINPNAASRMARSAEIHDYLKSQANSIRVLKGDEPSMSNSAWGLPDYLYGVEVVIEDAVRVSQRPVAAGTEAVIGVGRGYVKADDSAIIVSRVGGIDGQFGAPSYSTVQCYFDKYELAVESRSDDWNKLIDGRVVEKYAEVLACAPSGFLITNILSD